jgi:hypothetical protein
MPNIEVPKTDTNLGFQLSDRAADSSALAGRRIAQNYNETASAIDKAGAQIGSGVAVAKEAVFKYEAHQEIRNGALAFAQRRLALDREWHDRATDAAQNNPNDTSVGPEFREKVMEPTLDRFVSAFRTQEGKQWAEHQADSLRNHMFEKTAGDMATIAGHAAVVTHTQITNTMSTNAMEEPDSVKSILKDYDNYTGALAKSNPNMTATQLAKFQDELSQKGKENIVRSAVFGAIQKNPDTGLKLAQDPDLAPFINGMEVKQFETYARTQQRLQMSEAREQKRFAQEQAQSLSDQTVIGFRKRMGPDAEGPPLTREEINAAADGLPWSRGDTPGVPRLTRRDVEHIQALQEHYNREPPPTAKSAESYRNYIDQIRDGTIKTLGPIWAAESRGELTRQDSDRLQKAVGDLRTEAGASLQTDMKRFIAGAKGQIDKSVLGASIYTNGGMELYRFEIDLDRKMEEYRKQGKNPRDLITPGNPAYMGDPKVIQQYISPLDQSVRDAVAPAAQGKRAPISNFAVPGSR